MAVLNHPAPDTHTHTCTQIMDLLLCNLLSSDAIAHLCYTQLAVTHYLFFPARSDLSARSDQQMHSFKNADPGYSERRSKRTMAFCWHAFRSTEDQISFVFV